MNKHSVLNHLYSLGAIALCLLLGYGINWLIDFLPASLYGMLALPLGLQLGVIDTKRMQQTIDWIIKNMGVCFVPAGVGIMEHQQLIQSYGIAITVLIIISTLLLILVVGFFYQRSINKSNKHRVKSNA